MPFCLSTIVSQSREARVDSNERDAVEVVYKSRDCIERLMIHPGTTRDCIE